MHSRLPLKTGLGILALAGCFFEARGEVLIVDQGGATFQSVAAAVAAAKPGDTIQVRSGTYIGQLVLDKEIVLEGIGRPILHGSGKGSVLVVVADRCTIRGFIVEHSGGDLQGEDAGILLKSGGNRVEDNELRDILYGIYLYHSAGNVLRRNVVRGRRELGLGERGAGLHLWNSEHNTLEENIISDARDGMYIQSSPGNTIRGNRVSNLRYGLHFMSSDDNKFENNIFSNNIAGAAIMYSRRIELYGNAFVHNRGFSSFGILFQDCDECLAEGNFIIDNATGIFMEALRKSTFRRNVIAENDVALQVFSSADQNLFSENNFVENLSPLRLIGRRTNTRWAESGRGNYWSDYDGYDLDGNGVGDVPHKVQNVFEYLEGNYPRLRLYLNSPAAQALALAEKTLPIVKGSSEVDPAPLVKAMVLQFPLDRSRPNRPAQVLLGITSLAMLSIAIATITRGQRR